MFELPTVTLDDLSAHLARGAVLLDVREDEEWAAGHIDDAVHVPMNSVPRALAAQPDLVDAATPVVVICKMGGRSAQVTRWLRDQGYDAYNLEGGMLAWAGAHRPMTSGDGSTPYVA